LIFKAHSVDFRYSNASNPGIKQSTNPKKSQNNAQYFSSLDWLIFDASNLNNQEP